MAGFDKSLDKCLFTDEVNYETTKIKVEIRAYNEGQPKIQISRENLNPETGDWVWTKLGRLKKEEAQAVQEMLGKAVQEMDSN